MLWTMYGNEYNIAHTLNAVAASACRCAMQAARRAWPSHSSSVAYCARERWCSVSLCLPSLLLVAQFQSGGNRMDAGGEIEDAWVVAFCGEGGPCFHALKPPNVANTSRREHLTSRTPHTSCTILAIPSIFSTYHGFLLETHRHARTAHQRCYCTLTHDLYHTKHTTQLHTQIKHTF